MSDFDSSAPHSPWTDDASLAMFSEILRFETVSATGAKNGHYDKCSAWIVNKCVEIGLDNPTILPESVEHKPCVVAEWIGKDPTLPCVFLNSHYDVVPAMLDFWTIPPFEGLRRDERTYGRGAQDMKCVCVQYLVALQRLKCNGFQPLRTIRLSFVPDEEIGGNDGMKIVLDSEWFKVKSVGLALDEVPLITLLAMCAMKNEFVKFRRAWHRQPITTRCSMESAYRGGSEYAFEC